MLIEEAKWFGQKISGMDPDAIFPMLDVGSSTDQFRKRVQPWIDEYIFGPARAKGHKVLHADVKKDSGVDIVGDLSDACFLEELSKMRFNSVFCSSLLEHVTNREEICRALNSIIPMGGYIFLSCPYGYPYHADPIDTMFRPNVTQLAGMFPQTRVINGDIVTCGTYLHYITRKPAIFIKAIIRIFVPVYKPRNWLTAVSHLPWLNRNFQAACVVLQKC